MAWPEEFGGRGGGPVEHYIVIEELARARAPELVGRIGVNLVGPTLLAHGTTEQKARFLPRILDASEIWCQLFSEPGAGSDLTSLTTRARRRSTAASSSTGRRSGRATRSSPIGVGAWRAPIPTRRRAKASPRSSSTCTRPASRCGRCARSPTKSEFNEVFFSDVFVPDDQLVGPLHEGWRVANSTLTHERGVNPRQLVIHSQLRRRAVAARAASRARSTIRGSRRDWRRRIVEVQHLPAAQLAFDLAHCEGRGTGPGRQHQQVVVERNEQTPARHRDGGARPGAATCGGAPTTIPATARGSDRGSTTRPARSGRARTRSSATSSASARWGCRGKAGEPPAGSATYDGHATTLLCPHRRARARPRPRRLQQQQQILVIARRSGAADYHDLRHGIHPT